MKRHAILGLAGPLIAVTIAATCPGAARAQAGGGQAPKAEGAPESVEAIDREFQRELIGLERRRLERLAALASRQPKAEAQKTYEVYLASAIGRELFAEAEPVADKVLKEGDASPRARYLARVVQVLARVKRGDYEGSLASVEAACRAAREGADVAPPLSLGERLALLEIYFQALIRADQVEIARKALTALRDASREEALREALDARLAHLAMIGQPAPAIEGTDLDGRPFRLAELKGKVVLLVFWASWNVPNAREVERLKTLERLYRDRGLRIVGINVDALQEGSGGADAVLPGVRRFLLEQNVTWPNLVEGKGGEGYARLYGVREIPANFLIGRDGRVVALDVAPARLEAAIVRALGRN